MKRKSGRKSAKKEEENSNGVEDKGDQNGDTSDHDEDEAPKDKKRKSSKPSRKSVSFSSKKEDAAAESEDSEDQENDNVEEKKSTKSPRRASKKAENQEDDSYGSEEQEEDDNVHQKKKASKKQRKSTQKESKEKEAPESSEEQDEEDESQYEVEAVLDDKIIKGVRHYLIRWKGYEEESDTWEPEDTLDCDKLIQDFKDKKVKGGKKKAHKKEKKADKEQDWDENEDFEVDKILEVHHRKDGKREFLVSWKGYGTADNSWEPEDNMDCKDLIARFMQKVEKAKQVDERELRVNRAHVQRYTLSTQDSARRLSKRFRGKERVQYHDAE